MSQPVRQHPRPPAKGDYGIAVPFFAGVMVVALIGFWPAMVWHGYTDTGGWKWDVHSTVAEAVYFGVVAFIIGCVALGNRGPHRASRGPSSGPPTAALPPPRCRHDGRVPVDLLLTGERVAYLCPDCDTRLDEEGKPL